MSDSPRELLIQERLVVFVDDDQNLLKGYERNLRKKYKIRFFFNPLEAVQFIQDNSDQIMVVVSDYKMPGMNGVDLLGKVHGINDKIIRIMITGFAELETAIEAINQGNVFRFLTKPVKTEYIDKTISDAIDQFAMVYEIHALNKKLHEANEKLAQMAQTDPLTSLKNRRAFVDIMKKEWERSRRYDNSISFIMIDIDHFKNINDTYGHQMGDVVLKKVAAFMKTQCRETDFAARYGGEEFCILLPDTKADSAVNLASRIKEGVRLLTFSTDSGEFHVTVSLGISQYKEEFQDFDQFIEAADKALYKAKDCGRNCIVCD